MPFVKDDYLGKMLPYRMVFVYLPATYEERSTRSHKTDRNLLESNYFTRKVLPGPALDTLSMNDLLPAYY